MGRVPRTGHIVDFGGVYDSWQQLGPMARRVEDLILIMPLIIGPDYRDAAIVPMPWNDPGNVDVRNLRVAFYTENGLAETTPETREVVRRTATLLSNAGNRVEEDLPTHLVMEMEEVRLKLEGADAGAYLKRLATKWGTKTVSPTLTDRFFNLEELPMPEFTELLERQDAARSRLLSWLKDYDVVLAVCQLIESQTGGWQKPPL
jgi:amidase